MALVARKEILKIMREDKLEFEEQEEEQPTEILPKERRLYSDKPDRSIFELYRQYQKGNLELQPEFQRLQVWDNSKSGRLIESVLLEVPIPLIYLSEESDSKYSVIDGQQRLHAFITFLKNDLMLRGLRILIELNGKKFQDIPKNLQDKFENATIRIIEIRKEYGKFQKKEGNTLKIMVSCNKLYITCKGSKTGNYR